MIIIIFLVFELGVVIFYILERRAYFRTERVHVLNLFVQICITSRAREREGRGSRHPRRRERNGRDGGAMPSHVTARGSGTWNRRSRANWSRRMADGSMAIK